jgi:hypothetical protein
MTLSAAMRHAKRAKKAEQRKQQLKAKAETTARQESANTELAFLRAHIRDQLFGKPTGDGFYTAEQIAAADAALAAYTPEQRAAALAESRRREREFWAELRDQATERSSDDFS